MMTTRMCRHSFLNVFLLWPGSEPPGVFSIPDSVYRHQFGGCSSKHSAYLLCTHPYTSYKARGAGRHDTGLQSQGSRGRSQRMMSLGQPGLQSEFKVNLHYLEAPASNPEKHSGCGHTGNQGERGNPSPPPLASLLIIHVLSAQKSL